MTVDWERVRKTTQLGSTVPTPISANTANDSSTGNVWGLAADTPAQPYNDPPYGPDANAAEPPGSTLE